MGWRAIYHLAKKLEHRVKGFRPARGENFTDEHRRMWPIFNAIRRQSAGDVLIVTHAGVIRVILAAILSMELNDVLQIPQEYSALNRLESGLEGLKVIDINHVVELSGRFRR